MAARKRLDQILLMKGLVSETQIRAALIRQKMHGGKLGEHLLRSGAIREIELVGALSEQFGVPGVCLTGRELDPALFDMLPRRLAESYHCVPLNHDPQANTIDVAFADPGSGDAVWAVSEAIRPAHVKPFVAAETAIRAVLTLSLLPAATVPHHLETGLSPSHSQSDPITRAFTTLVEMAVNAAERSQKDRSIESVWSARLAEEMAIRLGLSNKIAQMIRLTALTAFCATWQRPVKGESMSAVMERSRTLLLTLDLPWDLVGLLTESARWNDLKTPSPAAQVLRTALAVGESKPADPSDGALDTWRKNVTSSLKWNLSPEFVAMAFSIVGEWWQRRQFDDPPREAMIVGTSALTETLANILSTENHRCVAIASIPEAIQLIRRRSPDLVCVHVASETGSTCDELADVFGAAPRHSTHVILVLNGTCSARVMSLARGGLAEVMADTESPAALAARIQCVLAPPPSYPGMFENQKTAVRTKPGGFPSVAGHLADMSLADLVQVLSSAQKTAKVIFRRQGHDAILWFQQGQIVSALTDGLTGENAFFDLVKWHDGTFEVHTTDDVPAKNVDSPTPGLLLEGYRRLDEWQRDRDQVATR